MATNGKTTFGSTLRADVQSAPAAIGATSTGCQSDEGEYETFTEEQITARMAEYQKAWDQGKQFVVSEQWHTPKEYVEAVRELMGRIDIDPASCAKAQERVQAKRYYTLKENGLLFDWYGKLFLNCSYHGEEEWFKKAVSEYTRGNVSEAVILTHTMRTYEPWFNLLSAVASAICLVKGEVKWAVDHALDVEALKRCGEEFHPKYVRHGSIVFYLGTNSRDFRIIFSQFGVCYGK